MEEFIDGQQHIIGEFAIVPGWLFVECFTDAAHTITAFGEQERVVSKTSPNRMSALAECLREILEC